MSHNFKTKKDLETDPSKTVVITGNMTYFSYFYPVYLAQKVYNQSSVNPFFLKQNIKLTSMMNTINYIKDTVGVNHLWSGYFAYMVFDLGFWSFETDHMKILGIDKYIPENEMAPTKERIWKHFKGNLAYQGLMCVLSAPFFVVCNKLI